LQATAAGPQQQGGGRPRAGGLVGLALAALACLGAASDLVAAGDAAWLRRAEGEREGRPQPGPILEAVSAYERALAADPDALEARWKLLRALHFAADFAARGEAARSHSLDRAREVADEGLDRLARRLDLRERPEDTEADALASRLAAAGLPARDVARLYFWAAINWGSWSRDVGVLNAVRHGVANRVYRYARVTKALEPSYENGGVFRLLGSLHAQLPRVPFISAWVDRDRAIPLIERAYELAPGFPGNRLLLALTLLDLAPERRGEALRLLRQVAELDPDPGLRIEELAMREQARERLAELGEG
jgi:tetratricopeptide (TPR) repeat protein